MAQNVSNAYLVAINAATEITTFSGEFSFVPPGAREGLVLSSSGFGQLGNKTSQLNNKVYSMGAKWASLERNRLALNGTFELIDSTKVQQTGDWGTAQSRTDGTFASPPWIEQTLDAAYDLIGVHIIFDDKADEYATEFTVTYYNTAGGILGTQVIQNTSASAPVNWQMNGVKRIRYALNRWNLPNRFAKVCQVVPGQIRYFRDDNTYSFLLREKITPFETPTIPEYTITFPNENQEYNIINPVGAVSKLRELMEIPSSMGLVTAAGVEYVNVGNFLLYSWPDNAQYETASLICRPDLAFANANYKYTAPAQSTVAAVAAKIATQAALKAPIVIDASLQNITVNANIGDRATLQDALGQLAVAAGGYIKFERDGSYSLRAINFTAAPVRDITYDNMWRKPDIRQNPQVVGFRMRSMNLSPNEFLMPAEPGTGRIENIISDFITSATNVNTLWQKAAAYYDHRLRYVIDYRGDMSIEPGDIVNVETDYGMQKVFVLEHETSWDNQDYLQGKIVGVGV